jgi:hypothetical protein
LLLTPLGLYFITKYLKNFTVTFSLFSANVPALKTLHKKKFCRYIGAFLKISPLYGNRADGAGMIFLN